MNNVTNPMCVRRNERGVTLVELMISMVLGILLTGAIIQVFIGNRESYAFNDTLSRIQENARFTLDHIAFNTRMSSYTGCLNDVAITNNLTIPNNVRDDIEGGIQGHNANGTLTGQTFAATAMDPAPSGNNADWTPALPVELNNLVLPGSDVLIVRSISGDTNTLTAPFSDASQLFIEGPHDFVNGELLVVTDCQRASIFQLTNVTTAGTDFVLHHANGGGFDPGNAASNWSVDQTYGLGSEVGRLTTHAFFIGRNNNNRPSLFQLRLRGLTATQSGFGLPEELVEGVDTMQVRYGVDNDNDGDVDNWVTADAVANFVNVLSVEISLLARADEEYGTETDAVVYNVGGMSFDPVNDRRLREVYSTTIGIRNRLP